MMKLEHSGWELPEDLGLIVDEDFMKDTGDDLKSTDGRFLVTIDFHISTGMGYYVKIYHDDIDDFAEIAKDSDAFIKILARMNYKPALVLIRQNKINNLLE